MDPNDTCNLVYFLNDRAIVPYMRLYYQGISYMLIRSFPES